MYSENDQRPLVLGVGNLLLGDEGVGVAVITRLEAAGLSAQADLVDGGTSGFHLLGLFRGRTHIVLIDAAADGKAPGTVSLIRPQFASDFPPTLTAHDIGLKDLIESAALLGDLPRVDLITISIAELNPMSMELSAPVAAALPQVQKLVESCLASDVAAVV
ncbi:MAG: Hydrogenase 2 maturation protease [Verrucomicrobiota bacterium]|jgi:hydrogenase maturation protease